MDTLGFRSYAISGGVVMLLIIGFYGGVDEYPGRPIQVGEPFPPLSAVTLSGDTVPVEARPGAVTFVNVWATWCGPCVDELPSMETLYRGFGGREIQIIAISIDEQLGGEDDVDRRIGSYVRRMGLTFTILRQVGDLQRVLGTAGVPESYLLDPEGIVRRKVIGPTDWASPRSIEFVRGLLGPEAPSQGVISGIASADMRPAVSAGGVQP